MTYFILGLFIGFIIGVVAKISSKYDEFYELRDAKDPSSLDLKKYKMLAWSANGQSAWAIFATKDKKIELLRNEASENGLSTMVIKSLGNKTK